MGDINKLENDFDKLIDRHRIKMLMLTLVALRLEEGLKRTPQPSMGILRWS